MSELKTTIRDKEPRIRTYIRGWIGAWPSKVWDCGDHEFQLIDRVESPPGIFMEKYECLHCEVKVYKREAMYKV